EFPLEASLSKLNTERGALMTVVFRDVTEQHAARAERQARESLEAASRAKTEFLSRMSHELRTPLNAVLGFAQLLRLDASRPPTVEQLGRIQHIENAGAHLLALVNDILDLSRVESGQMMVSLEAVDLQDAVADALGMAAEKLERLFEPFSRRGAENSNSEGTGIGLVLSRRLVELMEGDLLISSRLGLGTAATLVLKATDEPSTRVGLQAPPSQHG